MKKFLAGLLLSLLLAVPSTASNLNQGYLTCVVEDSEVVEHYEIHWDGPNVRMDRTTKQGERVKFLPRFIDPEGKEVAMQRVFNSKDETQIWFNGTLTIAAWDYNYATVAIEGSSMASRPFIPEALIVWKEHREKEVTVDGVTYRFGKVNDKKPGVSLFFLQTARMNREILGAGSYVERTKENKYGWCCSVRLQYHHVVDCADNFPCDGVYDFYYERWGCYRCPSGECDDETDMYLFHVYQRCRQSYLPGYPCHYEGQWYGWYDFACG